jgi:hypothetical protein
MELSGCFTLSLNVVKPAVDEGLKEKNLPEGGCG